ncbi:MAG: RimJ/RimL family protein N-acetyltransferase [Candidatus Azotimanducaceae bacterium]|jgi:RimJ/RimL family protein N-acetyltransferase
MAKLNFNQDYILENDVVQLRPLTNDDFDILSQFSLQEPELWTYSLVPAGGLENLRTYMDLAIKDKEARKSYPFIVYDKRTGKYAGSTRFYDYQEQHNTVQLGFTWYGKEFQGTGLNKNCKLLLLEFAFETLGLDRVEFRADASNALSIAAMKSIGCTVEGILRSNCKSLTGRRDSIVLSILKIEWLDSIKKNLLNKIND